MMVAYVAHAVLRQQREFETLARARLERRWQYLHPRDPANCRVGIIGLGHLGSAVAGALAGLGFDVSGWSRSARDLPGIRCHAGLDCLHGFLARADILVLLLPLTPATRGLLDRAALAALPRGAYLINVGRGATMDEPGLLDALSAGRLAGAMLDVFEQEPLPPGHPLWAEPRAMITPHQASVAEPVTAAAQVVENMRRALAGQPIANLIDRERGY